MPEIKNTFLKSRMNKDTEARILPQGEYRDAQNASVSASEDASVGSLENIRGNKLLTSFGLTDFNIEIIGQYADTANNRIYFFLTNFTDASADSLGNLSQLSATNAGLNQYLDFVRNGAGNYIAYCQLPNVADSSAIDQSNIKFDILVSGTFLNFSKTHPICGVNIIENLLFWTDNRNQPRKINVDNAISNPLTYYTNEDHISVAKYAPFEPISFLKNTTGVIESTLINETEEWLPAFWGAPGQIQQDNSTNNCLVFNENPASIPNNTSYSKILTYLGPGPFGQTTNPPLPASSLVVRVQNAQDPNGGYALVRAINTDASLDRVFLNNVSGQQITTIAETLGWGQNTVFLFSLRNPYYNSAFVGDTKLLEDKFVRFSYRFKYDDNEYSLSAPFTQHAFVPKQYGYFLEGDDEKTKASSIVEFMENQITTAGLVINLPYKNNELSSKLKVNEIQLLYKASDDLNVKVIADVKNNEFNQGVIASLSLVAGGSNYVNGNYPDRTLTYLGDANSNNTGSGAKANITVASGAVTAVTATISGENYRVGDELTYEEFGGTEAVFKVASLGTTYIYNYKSEKPIKVLTDEEVTRVSDIVPMRAQTQEVVGNRIIYGNFLQNNSSPLNLDYNLSSVAKGTVLNPATPTPPASTTNIEFLNNTIKQNRAYQVGVVLQDRYGRSSNVIINQLDLINKNSTIFMPYSNGGLDPLSWPGDSLQVTFNSPIPAQLSSSLPYNGLWVEGENPLGWYTYKVVVQQQEQDYYNVYVPGALSGNIIYEKNGTAGKIIPPATDPVADYKGLQYSNTSSVASIALFNDNINKIPRDLKEVGPTDNIYGSSVILYNRVKQTQFNASVGTNTNITIGQQNTLPLTQEVTTVRPFNELGEWTTKKNVDLHYLNSSSSSVFNTDTSATETNFQSQYVVGSFIYPGSVGDVDPFFLRNNKNPLIATINTQKRMGFTAVNQESTEWHFADKLMVFETKPFKSNIDIYYETSTTGIISELNNSILTSGDGTAATDAPFGLTELVVSDWFESSVVGQVISNTFGVVNSAGAAQGGSTALSTQVKIVEITNSLQVVINELDSNNQPNWPVSIERVSATGQAPTFRLLCNKRIVFENGSDVDDNYNITFEISTNTFSPIQVSFSEIKLTNINPIIYRISPSTSINGNSKNGAEIVNQTNPLILQNSSITSPISTIFPGNVGDEYAMKLNALSKEKPGSGAVAARVLLVAGRFSFLTNGFDPITVFNATTDSGGVNSNIDRLKGIEYTIEEVNRYGGGYKEINSPNPNLTTSGKYYAIKQGNFPVDDTTADFQIQNSTQTSSTLSINHFIKYVGDRSFPGMPTNNLAGSGYKGAYIYEIKLKIIDASRGTNNLPSLSYTIHYIIHR